MKVYYDSETKTLIIDGKGTDSIITNGMDIDQSIPVRVMFSNWIFINRYSCKLKNYFRILKYIFNNKEEK